MKKVAFVTTLGNYGGTEKSLIRLLRAIPANKYDITVFLIGNIGKIAEEIPEWVHIRRVHSNTMKTCLVNSLKENDWVQLTKSISDLLLRIIYRKKSFFRYELVLRQYEQIEDIYDIAITWSLPNSWETVFTLTNVYALEKWLWIHMDVSHDRQPEDAAKYFRKYDKIFCVSYACKRTFDRYYPECIGKSKVLYNIIDEEEIIELGQEDVEMNQETVFSIVTCGRLTYEKQPLLAIEIARELIKLGCDNFKWFFIGDGLLRTEMLKQIQENELEDYVVLLGMKKNPNAYVGRGDLYVQMSKHESFCMTLAEAQILGVPAVTTNFPSAYEIVKDNTTGYIVQDDWRVLCEKIEYLYKNQHVLEEMRNYLMKNDYYSNGSINDFLAYIE